MVDVSAPGLPIEAPTISLAAMRVANADAATPFCDPGSYRQTGRHAWQAYGASVPCRSIPLRIDAARIDVARIDSARPTRTNNRRWRTGLARPFGGIPAAFADD